MGKQSDRGSRLERVSAVVTRWAGSAQALGCAVGVVVLWAALGPVFGYSNTWQLVINTGTTIVTFLMVFLIQNAQNRDASAIQAKLDEIIRALETGRNEFIGIEHLTERELLEIRETIERECGQDEPSRHKGIETMIRRR